MNCECSQTACVEDGHGPLECGLPAAGYVTPLIGRYHLCHVCHVVYGERGPHEWREWRDAAEVELSAWRRAHT